MTLLLLGKQVLDIERDIRSTMIDIRVFDVAPTCIQPIRGVLIVSDLRKSLSPFL